MKAGFDRDFRIMHRGGIQFHACPTRAASKQVDGASTADHLQSPLPGGGRTDSFDHRIGPKASISNLANSRDGIVDFRNIPCCGSAEPFGGLDLTAALT